MYYFKAILKAGKELVTLSSFGIYLLSWLALYKSPAVTWMVYTRHILQSQSSKRTSKTVKQIRKKCISTNVNYYINTVGHDKLVMSRWQEEEISTLHLFFLFLRLQVLSSLDVAGTQIAVDLNHLEHKVTLVYWAGLAYLTMKCQTKPPVGPLIAVSDSMIATCTTHYRSIPMTQHYPQIFSYKLQTQFIIVKKKQKQQNSVLGVGYVNMGLCRKQSLNPFIGI